MNAPALDRKTDDGLDHPSFCWYHGFGSMCDLHETRPIKVLATGGGWIESDDDTVRVARTETSARKTLGGVYGTSLSAVDAEGNRVTGQMTIVESLRLAEEIVANARLAEMESRS